jgi:hypothetical protein
MLREEMNERMKCNVGEELLMEMEMEGLIIKSNQNPKCGFWLWLWLWLW